MNRRELLAGAAALLIASAGQADAFGLGALGRGFGRMGAARSAPLTGGISFAAGYPMDSVAAVTWTVAAGVGALTSTWANGPLFDLVVSGVTTTIFGVGPGYPDVRAIAAALNISPTSGISAGQISKWYNQQVGSPNSWVQAGAGSLKPQLYFINGKISVGWGGTLTRSDGGGITVSSMTSAASIDNRSFTLFAALNSYTTTNAGARLNGLYSAFFASGVGAAGTNIIVSDQSSYVNNLNLAPQNNAPSGGADYTLGNAANMIAIGIQPMIQSFTGAAAATTMWQNNTSASGPALVAGSGVTPLILGVDQSGTGCFSGRMQAVILSSSIFTAPQELAMRTSLAAWAGVDLAVNRVNPLNVVVMGASQDEGQGSVPGGGYKVVSGGGYGWAEIAKDAFPNRRISWHNCAISGQTLQDDTGNYTSGYIPNSSYQAGSTKNVVILGNSALGNTLGGNGDNGAAAYADFAAQVAAVKANTWTGIATLLFPPGTDPGGIAYNNLVRANAASLGITVLDMSANPNIGLVPTYANIDGHPTVAGSQLIASYVIPYLQTFL